MRNTFHGFFDHFQQSVAAVGEEFRGVGLEEQFGVNKVGFEYGVEIFVVEEALGLDAVQVAGWGGFLDHDVGAAAHWGAVEHGVRQDGVDAVGFTPAEGEDGPEVGSQLGEGFVVEFN